MEEYLRVALKCHFRATTGQETGPRWLLHNVGYAALTDVIHPG